VKKLIVNTDVNLEKHFTAEQLQEGGPADFIKRALNKNVDERYSAKQMLDHPWLKNLEAKIT